MSNSQNADDIVTPEIISKTYCSTKIRIHELCYVWTIENYSFHHSKKSCITSELFSSNTDDEYKWELILYPQDSNKVQLTVRLSSSGSRSCYAKCNVNVMDSKRKAVYQILGNICEYNTSGHTIPLLSREALFNERSTLLPNDTLTITCEVIFSSMQAFNVTSNQIKSFQQTSNAGEKKMCQDLRAILKNQLFTDVVLTTHGEVFPVHKNILAARSPVFAAMFTSKMVEGESNCVEIKDIDGEILENILLYIYTGRCESSIKLADRLLVAAEKYDLQALKRICEDELIENLSIDNALDTLLLAEMNCASELKSETIKFIVVNFIEVMNTEAWKNFNQTNSQLLKEICEALWSRKNLILCKYLKLSE